MRFIGEYLAKTDAKGRVFFPAAFRKVVDTKGAPQSFVLRSDLFQKCLVLYPESVWNSRLDEMQARMNHWKTRCVSSVWMTASRFGILLDSTNT